MFSQYFSPRIALCVALVLPFMGSVAYAKPELTLKMSVEKEVIVVEAGKKVLKLVSAQPSAPGDVLVYTLNYKNVGDEKATAVNVDNPLPKDTHYIAGSISGANAKASGSIDGGKTFTPTDKIKADAAHYTTLRWTINEVLPGQGGQLGFRATVE
jgi:uncharacterized repeat protein (TIGR01451 family)